MAKLFTNEKEIKRAIQAAIDQHKKYRQNVQKMEKRKDQRSKRGVV